jgi:hypothetical protein
MASRFLTFSFVAAMVALAGSSPVIAADSPSPASAASPASRQAPIPPPPALDPRAQQLLQGACESLASSKAFTFHVEITFDQVLPSDVKLQFAAAADYAVQRPDQLAVDFHSDLGAKKIWYSGDKITMFDPPHMVYASTEVPDSIDGMMEQLETANNLSIPLADMAYSHPCDMFRKGIVYSAYVGVNDVNGEDCDHLAFAKKKVDWQIWLQRSGKHLPRKIVINYRTAPGSPEYAGVLSDWKFPASIPASVFEPVLPKDAKRIDFKKVKEPKP